MLKPIETIYKGYRFRSRLEARWAVFFDCIGEEYQYELEGYDLGGVWYLPDFFLPNRKTWVEIKPTAPNKREWEKIERLVKTSYYDDHDGWMIVGQPWGEFDEYSFGTNVEYVVYTPHVYATKQNPDELRVQWNHDVFVQCRECDYIGLEGREFHFEPYISQLSEGEGYGICCPEKTAIASSLRIKAAYTAARQARFEH